MSMDLATKRLMPLPISAIAIAVITVLGGLLWMMYDYNKPDDSGARPFGPRAPWNVPVAQLTAVEPTNTKRPKVGTHTSGPVGYAENCFHPLTDEELAEWGL